MSLLYFGTQIGVIADNGVIMSKLVIAYNVDFGNITGSEYNWICGLVYNWIF